MKARISRVGLGLSCLALLVACAPRHDIAFTLYRTAIDLKTNAHDEAQRIHIATFDAALLGTAEDNGKYNRANCDFAQELFSASQPHLRGSIFSHIKLRYWCERGSFKL